MSIKDARKKCIALGLKSPTSQELIEILSKMQGFSKQENLLEKEYYKNVGKKAARSPYSNFRRLCLKFLEFDLLQEREASSGYRIALNKKVWDQCAETIGDLVQYATLLQEDMRSDTQISTIVSKVRRLYQEDANLEISYSIVEPIVAFALAQKNPDIQDGKFIRFKHTKRRPEQIYESRTHSSTKIKEQDKNIDSLSSLAGPKKGTVIDEDKLWPTAILDFLKDNSFQVSFHPSQEIIVAISLAQNRTQQVYIRRDTHDLLRIETISGSIEEVEKSLIPIFKRNDEISPVKIAVMDREGIQFIGCVSGASLTSTNLPLMKELVIKTARLGDELENTYWGKDLY